MKPIDGYRDVTDEIIHPRCQNVDLCTRDSVICINGAWLCEQCAILEVQGKNNEGQLRTDTAKCIEEV